MSEDYEELANRLSMAGIIRLQDALSKALVRRFEKRLALAFADIVGSTPYFAKFGDAAGRKLQQRHVDLVQRALAHSGGRIVDTAGDGAFLCFPNAEAALKSMMELQQLISVDNDSRPAEERLSVRTGCHFGPVLTDEVQVSGDAVNYCSRIAASASGGEIRISREAFLALTDVKIRLKARRLPPIVLKGIDRPAELLSLDWHDHSKFPVSVRFEDGTVLTLPAQDVIRFGRLKEQDGMIANDVVLTPADPAGATRVSRWHFELQRKSTGFVLRSVSDALTEVDGQKVGRGQELPIRVGALVRVGGVMTLHFQGDPMVQGGDSTILPA
ncbi:MAG: adenylate/guanylate cyclase domain-containing protein [Myxococcaceae bacterium]